MAVYVKVGFSHSRLLPALVQQVSVEHLLRARPELAGPQCSQGRQSVSRKAHKSSQGDKSAPQQRDRVQGRRRMVVRPVAGGRVGKVSQVSTDIPRTRSSQVRIAGRSLSEAQKSSEHPAGRAGVRLRRPCAWERALVQARGRSRARSSRRP